MNIREYQAQDLESLAELMGDLGYPTHSMRMKHRMDNIQSDPMCFTFLAEMDGNIVGMVGVRKTFLYEVDDVATQITVIVTKEGYRNKGIGTALIKFVEEWAEREGTKVIVLTSGIKAERLKAHELYKTAGFDITGYRFVKKLLKDSSE